MQTIYHIINTYQTSEKLDSSLDLVQGVTVQSLINAKNYFQSLESPETIRIKLCYVQSDFDNCKLPSDFKKLPDLKNSVLDYFEPVSGKKPLPILIDILSAIGSMEPEPDDIIVYSNADIAVRPTFFSFVSESISNYDSIVINRRDVSKCDRNGRLIALMICKRYIPFKGILIQDLIVL